MSPTTTPKAMIFGREPAFWIGVIEALLALLLSWNLTGLNADQIGGIMAVVVALAGVFTAYVTRDTMLGVLVGLTKALFILLATFQINLNEAQTTTAIALITVLAGAFNRTQTTPAAVPGFRDPSAGSPHRHPADGTLHRPEDGQVSILYVFMVLLVAVLAVIGFLALVR